MAHFADLGAHCSLVTCKQKDFLPFTCELCSRIFCLDHRTYESHNCPHNRAETVAIICPRCQKSLRVPPGEDSSMVFERHSRTECKPAQRIELCPVPSCNKKLTQSGSVVCSKCRCRVCLAHRYEDAHPCDDLRRGRGRLVYWLCLSCKVNNAGLLCAKCGRSRPAEQVTKPDFCVIL